MEHLVIDITPLLEEPGSTIDVRTDYAIEPFDVGGAVYVPVAPATVDLTLLDSGSGIVATGSIRADLSVECSRCLVPFSLHVEAPVDGLFLDEAQAAAAGEDEEFERLRGHRADLRPLLDASLRIELPFAPVHDESCKGICPHCGCNLNEETCECESEAEPGGPFDALRGLLEEED